MSQNVVNNAKNIKTEFKIDKNDKDMMPIVALIQQHPLFSVLKLMIKKCQTAMDVQNGFELISNEVFKVDDVVQLINVIKEKYNASTNLQAESNPKRQKLNKQVENILREAIINFRIQLCELAKVWELCERFCQKYIEFLKSIKPASMPTKQSDVIDDKMTTTILTTNDFKNKLLDTQNIGCIDGDNQKNISNAKRGFNYQLILSSSLDIAQNDRNRFWPLQRKSFSSYEHKILRIHRNRSFKNKIKRKHYCKNDYYRNQYNF